MAPTTQARDLAAESFDLLDKGGEDDASRAFELIEALCHLATSSNPEEARAGADALFGDLVEGLADRFEPRLCDAYVELFSRVIDFCRRLPRGAELDRRLRAFGLDDRRALLDRADRVRRPKPFALSRAAALRKILVLSRVTLGADIAVTSVVLAKLKQLAPHAEIRLVGGPKSAAFFASDPRISALVLDYPRGGTLMERLDAWFAPADAVAAEIAACSEGEFLVVDPDSRMTQLGLLSLTPKDVGYCFLETRSFGAETDSARKSLSQLTAKGLESLFGPTSEPLYPYVSLPEADLDLGRRVRGAVQGKTVAVNLGVGNNDAKRVDDTFERRLIALLVTRGYRVLLDRGAGEDELKRMDRLEEFLCERGLSVSRIVSDGMLPDRIEAADVMTWQGSLSAFAGITAAADLYIGYDSAGGHLAAALRVPVISVFAGAPNDRMRERWSPRGPARADVIAVEQGEIADAVLGRVEELLP